VTKRRERTERGLIHRGEAELHVHRTPVHVAAGVRYRRDDGSVTEPYVRLTADSEGPVHLVLTLYVHADDAEELVARLQEQIRIAREEPLQQLARRQKGST